MKPTIKINFAFLLKLFSKKYIAKIHEIYYSLITPKK